MTLRGVVWPFFGVLAILLGTDVIAQQLNLWWWWLWGVRDFIAAAIIVVLLSVIARHREQREQRRKRQIAYLNHHIRNSLAALEMACAQKDDELRKKVVRASINRMIAMLQRMEEGDVRINEREPHKP